jgi:hypothetical protein
MARSTMGQNRLSELALLHVHRSINIDIDKIRDGLTYREIGNLPDGPVLVWAALY